MVFAIGLVAGLLGNFAARKAARKVSNFNLFEDKWYDADDMQHW